MVAREEAAGRARPASGGMGVVLSYASIHLSCGEHMWGARQMCEARCCASAAPRVGLLPAAAGI